MPKLLPIANRVGTRRTYTLRGIRMNEPPCPTRTPGNPTTAPSDAARGALNAAVSASSSSEGLGAQKLLQSNQRHRCEHRQQAPSGTFEDTTAPIRAKIATLVPMYPPSRHDTYPEEWCRTTPETARQPLSHGEADYFLHGKAAKANRLRSVQQDRRKQNPAAETQQSRQESSQ